MASRSFREKGTPDEYKAGLDHALRNSDHAAETADRPYSYPVRLKRTWLVVDCFIFFNRVGTATALPNATTHARYRRGVQMQRRKFIGLIVATAACPFAAIAQSKGMARIAILGSLNQNAINIFKEGLREFGLIEGETIIVIGTPASAASPEEVSKAVSDLISQKIDLIFASGAVAGKIAKGATSTIPIVCLTGDLVRAGIVQSLSSPGGNATGISLLTAEASAKRLELLKQLIPALERVAAFYNIADPTADLSLKPTEAAAKKLQLTVEPLGVRGESDFGDAFAAAMKVGAQAIAFTSNPLFDIAGSQIAVLALQNKLATISFADSYPKVGGLFLTDRILWARIAAQPISFPVSCAAIDPQIFLLNSLPNMSSVLT